MTSKENLTNLSWDINDLLSQYIEIHNNIFKTSIRQRIPIPGIFKAINFSAHLEKIEEIMPEMESLNSKIKLLAINSMSQEKEYLNLLSRYTDALIKTAGYLKIVISALYDKSKSSINSSYNWKNYKKDLAIYEQSIKNYMTIGGQLNNLFDKIKFQI